MKGALGSAPDPLYPFIVRDAAVLACLPCCKQMDARLNMHGWSSDIVLGLRAASEAGLES